MRNDERETDRGAQEELPGEREERDAHENTAGRQDLEKPPEGRDVPPEDTGTPARDPKSPWMGGG